MMNLSVAEEQTYRCLSLGKLTELKELNVSYNRLSRVPPELGNCENLKRLELTGNLNLSELPFEVRQVDGMSRPVVDSVLQSGHTCRDSALYLQTMKDEAVDLLSLVNGLFICKT